MLWDEFLFAKHPEELIAYLEAGGDIDSEASRQADIDALRGKRPGTS